MAQKMINTAEQTPFNMQDEIDYALVDTYLEQSRIAVYCSLAMMVYLAVSYYHVASLQNIFTWLVIFLLVNLYIVYTSLQFNREIPVYKIIIFKRRQHFLHILAGLAWGSTFIFLLDSNHPSAPDYRVAGVIGTVIALSASTKSASLFGMVGFVLATSLLSALYFITHFQFFGWWFFSLLGLVSVTLLFGWKINQYIFERISNRVRSEVYLEELRALNDKIQQANEDFIKRNLELQDMQKQLQILAARDSLTGLHNRRYILERIEEKLPEIKRHRLDCCIVMMDIDHFKHINDHFGHAVGDDVLRAIAKILMRELRQEDIVARYGGEEFLMFLPMTELSSARLLVERLRLAIAVFPYHANGEKFNVTASFGITQHIVQNNIDRTIDIADKALYQAKVAGRNCVVVSPS